MPSVTLARPFSSFLISSQLATTCSARRRVDVAEDMGVAVDQLVVHAAGHLGQGEQTLFLGQPGVEDDLEEKVPQLFGQMVPQ